MFPRMSNFSWLFILDKISKTLGITRRFIPLYTELKPLIQKVPVVIDRVKNITTGMKNAYYQGNNLSLPNDTKNSLSNSENSPTFFQ